MSLTQGLENIRVYFHIDEIARDAIVASIMKKTLQKHNIMLHYGNRRQTSFLGKSCPFDLVILPDMNLFKDLIPDPESIRCPIIILPTESIGGVMDDTKRGANKILGYAYIFNQNNRWVSKVSAFCLWGRNQLLGIREHAPEIADLCHVVGHPRFDARCQENRSDYSSSTRSLNRIKIGLVSRFSLLNPHDDWKLPVVLYNWRKSKDWRLRQNAPNVDSEDNYYTAISDLRIMYDLIDRLDPCVYDVEIRVHPRENRLTWQEVINKNRLSVKLAPWDTPFSHWIKEQDWIISPPSTSYYDVIAAGKPLLGLGLINPKRIEHELPISDDRTAIVSCVDHPSSLEELMVRISVKPDPIMIEPCEKARIILEEDTDFPLCRNSIDKITDTCLKIIKGHRRIPKKSFDLLKFHCLCLAFLWITILRARPEQGTTFRLTKKRIAWIDSLYDEDRD